MTEHFRSLAGFLHNFKRLFEPAPPATVAPHLKHMRGNR